MKCVALALLLPFAVALVQAAEPSTAQPTEPFEVWLAGVREEALGNGVSPAMLDQALAGIRPLPRVIELDRNQPESTLTFEGYVERVVPESRVVRARRMLDQHAGLLARVADRFDVQPRFVVALWGIESDFGRVTGGFSVVEALATLAWDGRRGAFFRRELMAALQILEEGHVAPSAMQGSWAGAMGQSQFMPTTFRQFAVDLDGDNRRDIWGTLDDVFASTANYLSSYGWSDDQTWGREVRLPRGFDRGRIGLEVRRPMSHWRSVGVKRANGAALPGRELEGSIVQPGGASGPAYLIYDNYRTLLRWNRSLYFATAVGLLSDRLR